MNKNKKNQKNMVSGEDHYTNLMLIVVLEAMVLLIIQMLIYNSYGTELTVNTLIPAFLIIALIMAAVSLVLYFVLKKKNAIVTVVFGAYVALLMGVIKYIPNSYEPMMDTYYANTLRGQKIGLILSVIYVVGGIVYCILAEKRRVKLKNK